MPLLVKDELSLIIKNRAQTINITSTYAPKRKTPKNPKYRVIIAVTNSSIRDLGFTVRQRKAQIVNSVGQFIEPKGE